MNYKTKRTLKQILAVALAGLAAFGAIFGLVKLSEVLKEETKVIHPSFSVGGLNANGEYDETDGSIYTKESFECQGMSVKLDFDSNVSYQAFYYDDLDKYISSSSVYEESMDLEVPVTAVYARLEVTPIWAEDVEEEDQVVHWYNVAEYANQLEISVLKEQKSADERFEEELENLVNKTYYIGEGIYDTTNDKLTASTSGWHWYQSVDCTDSTELIIKVATSDLTAVQPDESNYSGRAMMNFYDVINKEDITKEITYDVIYEDGDVSYILFDVTDYGKFIWSTSVASVGICEAYLR